MNELLQALLNAANRDLAIGFGKESHNKFQVTILDCHTQTSRERILTEAELEQLPQIIDELIQEFEERGSLEPEPDMNGANEAERAEMQHRAQRLK